MQIKNIALIAHDNMKKDLAEWVLFNLNTLKKHHLITTGTTGKFIEEAVANREGSDREKVTLNLTRLKSGPLGGDQQMGALIADEKIDLMIFFWDPMQPHPHDVDVKALLRIATVYNIPLACNRSTADFIVSSPLMEERYKPKLKDFSGYIDRNL
ncbi:methylglyoxal synthase [candidate division KSB1 bacterium 4484_87]|nr:MAG: methylglyoxal synthase [candidate division KSB1 bacterium 4484_87]